jgi:DNA replication initiation complex subunit (GINS family)
LALFLEEEGIIEILTHDNKYYQRLIVEERKGKSLKQLPEDFYEVAEVTLKKTDPEYRKKLIVSLRELIELRMEKLMRHALQGTEVAVPHHEKILYNRVRKAIEDWITDLEGMINGDRV